MEAGGWPCRFGATCHCMTPFYKTQWPTRDNLSIYPQIKEIIYNCTRLYCTYAIGLDVWNGNVLLFSDRCLQKLSTTSSSGKKCHEYLRARCIKTPLMTPTAAKPNTPLKRMVSRLKAGLRSSCASRATGTQVPRVIWNIVSIPGSGQGPADGAAIVPQVTGVARKLMIADRCC